jgi:hypothetical protein
METHRIETTLEQDGTLMLKDLPFRAGEAVEVIILAKTARSSAADRYPLRGTPITYADPFEPVAVDDWESAR